MWNKVSSILNQKLTRVLINRSDTDVPGEVCFTALEWVKETLISLHVSRNNYSLYSRIDD
jgi:hypothetical protein